jgi:hypothetical protein
MSDIGIFTFLAIVVVCIWAGAVATRYAEILEPLPPVDPSPCVLACGEPGVLSVSRDECLCREGE